MNQPQQQYLFNFFLDRHVEDIHDFQEEHPTPFENIDNGIDGAWGWVSFKFYVLLGFVFNFFFLWKLVNYRFYLQTFLEFLNEWQNNNYRENLWWEYNKWNRVICLELEGRKLFLGIADIVISFHENGKFSGNLFQRIRILPNLNVTHESSPLDN